MNLVIHQFKKDLSRVRLPLAVWLLFVALQFGLAGWDVKPGDQVMQYLHTILGYVLPVINALLIMVLVPLVFHQEPLVGTTAFWLTRPLPRNIVMAAKGLFLVLLIALPLLAQTMMLAVNGVTAHDIALATPQIVLSQLSWVLAVAALATLTAGFGRFAVTGVIAFIVWYLLDMAVGWLRVFTDPMSISQFSSLTSSRTAIGALLTILFGAAVVAHQYRTRRTRRSVIVAVVGGALVLGVQQFWPWNMMPKARAAVVQGALPDTGKITFDFGSKISSNDYPDLRGGTPVKAVSTMLAIHDAAPETVILVRKVAATLKTAGGESLKIQQTGMQGFGARIPVHSVEAALGDGATIINPGDAFGPYVQLFQLDAPTFNAHQSEPLSFTAQVTVQASRYAVAGELPLTKGARFRRGSEQVVITDVLKQPLGLDVALRERKIRLQFAPGDEQPALPGLDSHRVLYVLLNRKKHEAVLPQENTTFDFLSMMNQDILVSHPLHVSFGPNERGSRDEGVFPLPADWMAGAVLVRLELLPGVEIVKPLASDHLRMDGKNDLGVLAVPAEPETTLASLEKITLADDPTREQVTAYVDDILAAARRQRTFRDTDPEIEMLLRIGAPNADLLLEKARTSHNYYLLHAIQKLAGDEEKERVLAILPENPDLVQTVIAHKWQADAKDILVAGLAKARSDDSFPTECFQAVAELKDPATYGVLRDYFVLHPNGFLYKHLKPLPDFDLTGALDLAWTKAAAVKPFRPFDLLPYAVQGGKADALNMAGGILKGDLYKDNTYARQEARRAFQQATTAPGKTDQEFAAWYDSSKDRLVFDPAVKKFTVPAPDPAPVPTAQPQPQP